MCNTSECKYEDKLGKCTIPKIVEDSLCYHPKIDAMHVTASFDVQKYMRERDELCDKQRAICDQIMIMHERNTVDGLERLLESYRKQRQALLDEIALQQEVDWEPLRGSREDVQRISRILNPLPSKAEIDALGWGTDKVSRVKAIRRLTCSMRLSLKEALAHINKLYYQDGS